MGGEAIADKISRILLVILALLHSLGVKVVLVHGARPQINQILETNNRTTPYHKDIRITDEEALGLVMQAAGQLQHAITCASSMSQNNNANGRNNTTQCGHGNFVISTTQV